MRYIKVVIGYTKYTVVVCAFSAYLFINRSRMHRDDNSSPTVSRHPLQSNQLRKSFNFLNKAESNINCACQSKWGSISIADTNVSTRHLVGFGGKSLLFY